MNSESLISKRAAQTLLKMGVKHANAESEALTTTAQEKQGPVIKVPEKSNEMAGQNDKTSKQTLSTPPTAPVVKKHAPKLKDKIKSAAVLHSKSRESKTEFKEELFLRKYRDRQIKYKSHPFVDVPEWYF